MTLRIRRFDPVYGRRELRDYTVEAPEWASLLDALDLVKERLDGSLSFRRSCRMMICGSCGMRLNGRSVLACRERLAPLVETGGMAVVEPLGNLPVIKDLVVDMEPFWDKQHSLRPWLEPAHEQPPDGRENVLTQGEADVVQKESLCVNCACCVSECESWREDPEFLGPHALVTVARFACDVRDGRSGERLEAVSGAGGVWSCTRCQACDERCPKGIDPRGSIAKLTAELFEHGELRDRGARQALRYLRSPRRAALPPRGGRFPQALGELRFVLALLRQGKARLPFRALGDEARLLRQLHELVREQDRRGALGIVQGEQALARIGAESGAAASQEDEA